jgi:TetR/AcrR family transcriptional regulator, lmrAB and yxaGH operons repressor
MAATRIEQEQLFLKISEVFRRYGYEGTSIRLLSQATGLERASLYHRFPGGKEEMAAAIVAGAGEWFEQNVFAPLRGPGPASDRLRRAALNLRRFYRGGTLWCVLDSMTLGGAPETVRLSIREAYEAWLKAFTSVAIEDGASAAVARSRAAQALIEIEGSLVIARVLGSSKPFLRVVENLPDRLLRANPGEPGRAGRFAQPGKHPPANG